MYHFTDNPVLGHITTFGGHPVCCAAGLAAFHVLLEERLAEKAASKAALLPQILQHPKIRSVRSFGLWAAVEFDSFETCKNVIDLAIEAGVFSDWFLFAPNCLRISPPLTITEAQLKKAAAILLDNLEKM